ncbi:hypothetical protein Q5752_004391 [Cryptotrichosporon argae]
MSVANLDNFQLERVSVKSQALGKDVHIACRKASSEPPLLLLHGYPQTSHIWHKIAGRLSERFTVVATDLRGYRASDKPAGSDSHVEYSKREMAADQVQVMSHYGFERFSVVGHDRGGRVAHRLALDHLARVDRLMVLDILPTLYLYEHTNMTFAQGYWHWFFLTQPAPGPEKMILSGPEEFWETMSRRESHKAVVWSDADLRAYNSAFVTPEGVHASCEDYCAAASIDLEHDRAGRAAGRKLEVERFDVVWGGQGMMPKFGDVVGLWRRHCGAASAVSGTAFDSGHYIPEERPDELLERIYSFLA